jgi:hypothetical protein
MSMKSKSLLVGLAVVLTGSLLGCDQKQTDDLLAVYRSHAIEAQGETGTFMKGDMSASSMDTMLTHAGAHLDEMHSVRMKMSDQCHMASACPGSGGATGEMSGNHMNGGQYLDGNQMGSLADKETHAQNAMDEMDTACTEDAADLHACMQDHGEIVDGIFQDMVDYCSAMMNGEPDASDEMGPGMMDGGRM